MPKLLDSMISQKAGEIGAIPDSSWANSMRVSMENKNLLAKKGSIYVGMGEAVRNSVVDGDGQTQEVARTVALNPPIDAINPPSGTPVKKYYLTTDNDSANATGLKWGTLELNSYNTNISGVAGDGTSSGWATATGTNPAGTYQYTISAATHKLAGSNIIVQIMQQSGTTYTIVNTTIDIDTSGNVTIYSNVLTPLKVLLLAIGG